ncbi:MAG: GNAT family N-acetyltransferase [Bacillaceae bacterium]
MKVRTATIEDASLIHRLMLQAFSEYKDAVPPSSALEETVQSISTALENGEQALICYENDEPVGMIRFHVKGEILYFYRLSVVPSWQGQGIAKKLLVALEGYANKHKILTITCKVRMNVPRNIQLYHAMGYSIYDEEIVYKPNGIGINVVSMKKRIE